MKSKVLNISFDKDLSKNSYDIVIGTNLISDPTAILKKYIEKRKVIIIHDEYFSLKPDRNNYFYKFDGKRCYQYAIEFDNYLNKLQKSLKKKKNLFSYVYYFFLLTKKELKKVYRLLGKKTLIDNRGRYDNRISDTDKKKNFLKFEKMKCIKELLDE